MFLICLNVKGSKVSKEFYETLVFTEFAGELERNYLIMKNGDAIVGLFQGMFEVNIFTINPGWNKNTEIQNNYADARAIQKHSKSSSIKLVKEADESTKGPESITLFDPDRNTILIDQHV